MARTDARGAHTLPVTFLNVGANDGLSGNPLAEFIIRRGWTGLMVEPVGFVFQRLQKNHGHRPGIILANAAVGQTHELRRFWYLEKNSVLAPGYDQIGSLDKAHVLAAEILFPGLKRFLRCQLTLTLTLPQIMEASGHSKFDVVLIDAEGADGGIIRQIDFSNPPKLIVFEHCYLTTDDRVKTTRLLTEKGYEIETDRGDTIARMV